MPAGISKLVNLKGVNWDYHTEPEPALRGRRLWWPRGRVLGGSSSINAMCYVRGHPADYDEWAALGNPGWDWQSVLPYFKRSENQERGGDALHGSGGLLNVQDHKYRNPLSAVFLEGAREAGFGANADFNGPAQEGFGWYQVTQKNGARWSTAAGYLGAARGRPNLRVVTGALAEQVRIEGGRAVGVRYRHRGRSQAAEAAREVILAGGALNSPQLLMLSGVGPAQQLRAHGIAPRQDLAGVGANLHDHLDACTIFQCTQRITYDRASEVLTALRYFLFRDGPGTSNIAEAGGFARSRLAPDARPDIQFHFVPAMLDDHGRNRLPGDGYTLHACFLRPRSRGRVALVSDRAGDKPKIEANYLSDPEGFDLKMMLECAKISRDLLNQRAFDAYRGSPVFPARNDLGETDIHAFGKQRMIFDHRPNDGNVDGVHIVDKEHAMGIAHRNRARRVQDRRAARPDLKLQATRVQFFRQRNLRPVQTRRAHIHRHLHRASPPRLQQASFGFDGRRIAMPLLHHEPGGAARRVTACTYLAAIGVPDAHEHVGAGGFRRFKPDDLIRARIVRPAACGFRRHTDLDRVKRQRAGTRVQHCKAVAAAIHL